MKIKFHYFLIVFVLFNSCLKKSKNVNFINIENDIWSVTDSLFFNFKDLDSEKKYFAQLTVKHKTDYYYQNLILFLQANNQIDTLNLQLAKKNGTWNGKGAGDTRFYSKTLKNLNFDKKDSICIVVNHAMRSANTNQIREIRGVSSVGLEIIKED
ncbi:MAG: hypothetical protein CMP71_06635 [Flavobacteriales bacterium]|nr:hypothetical protein [Flavobacteriales bacterium]